MTCYDRFGVRALVAAAILLTTASVSAEERAAAAVVAPTAAVAADHPLASDAGIAILRAGGNAVDAAVAVGLVLGVVNPFASGIGGGGFLLVRDPSTGVVEALDFRETAPRAAHRDLFVADGAVIPGASRDGGLAVAVPGEVAGWWAVHQRYGALPWAEVVAPAHRLADEGFVVAPLLPERLSGLENLATFAPLADAFSVSGRLVEEGDVLTRPALAATLAAIAEQGRAGFYDGWVAQDLVDTVARAGGILTRADLAEYEVRWLSPTETLYRGYTVYGMPLPSSGGLVIAQVLAALEAFPLSRTTYQDVAFVHLVTTMLGYAFADRAQWLGDGVDRAEVTARMLGQARITQMRAGYDPEAFGDAARFGPPVTTPTDAGTSHFSVIDAGGMAVACTTTINTSFGSKVLGDRTGVVLNNEMDDFSAQPGVPNAFGLVGNVNNAVVAGHRPLSSMSPTLVVDDAGVVGALGGSGGPRIITGTLLALIQLIDFETSAAEAISAPRFHHQWLPERTFVELGASASWFRHLASLGHTVTPQPFGNAVQVIWRHAEGWEAASDPRKYGAPAGY